MINKRLALSGIGRQTAGKGTALANPGYGFGLLDGRVIEVPITQELEEITGTSPVSPGANRTAASPGLDASTRAYPKLLGALLYGALGAVATSGPISTVYTHVFTGTYDTPYFSLFGRQGSDYARVADAKFDELTLKWDEAGPLEVSFKALGRTLLLGTTWTAGVSEADSDGKFRARGGVFKLDTVGGASPAQVAFVKSGEITISREVDAVALADSIIPADIVPSMLMVSSKFTIVPDDLAEWRKTVTGTGAGTAISEAELYGSFDHLFTIDANNDLRVNVERLSFTADFPSADAKGGALEIEVEGEMVQALTGESITATLRNTVASY